MPRTLSLTNKKFGMLTAIKDAGKSKSGNRLWECKCDCGRKAIIIGSLLVNGHTKSCSCRRGSQYFSKHESGVARVFLMYKNRSGKRGLVFELTKEEFESLISSNCYYCEAEPAQISDNGLIYNGIDRINNNVGYLFDNCVPCCRNCNWMKGTASREEFLTKIAKIYRKHLK